MRWRTLACVAILAATTLTGCSTAGPTLTPSFDTTQIHEVDQQQSTIGGIDYTATYYENEAYDCGRTGVFPFLVLEQEQLVGTAQPIWVMLHGGGIGFYKPTGSYVGDEEHNDQESAATLGEMALGFLGADGKSDTFIGDRIRAGDRVILGSLCDHDLMLGLGQPDPNNPRGGLAEGLLANLAMLAAVETGAPNVERRPTSSTWIFGASAGSYGAYALAHNLWLRDETVDGLVMDSGVLGKRTFTLFDVRRDTVANSTILAEKLGPYFTDSRLWAENAVIRGFDVPLFDVTEMGDPECGGQERLVAQARAAGYIGNCAWLHGGLGEAIAASGDPLSQIVRNYPGSTHTATNVSGIAMQSRLRSWYASITGKPPPTPSTDPRPAPG
jgi:hypothetical protein